MTTTASPLELASLLCSRLCHDMMSPVGALTNGLELLADEQDPDMRKRCFELLEQSAKIAADKLRFFRLAFGAGGTGPGEPVPVAEARALVEGLTGASQRIAVNWVLAGETLPLAAVKTLLNFALIGTQALVRGGQLDLGAEQTGHGVEIVVRAAAARIVFDPDVGRALDGTLPEGEITSRTAPAVMTRELAASLGGHVQFIKAADSLLLGAELPSA
jgi:histidine phosphotransferase ChpT